MLKQYDDSQTLVIYGPKSTGKFSLVKHLVTGSCAGDDEVPQLVHVQDRFRNEQFQQQEKAEMFFINDINTQIMSEQQLERLKTQLKQYVSGQSMFFEDDSDHGQNLFDPKYTEGQNRSKEAYSQPLDSEQEKLADKIRLKQKGQN